MKKLLQFQQKVQAIKKDANNPFYNSKYFDINGLLDAVKPVLNECGLVVLQPLTNIIGKPAIRTIILDGENGEIIIDDTTVIPEILDPQKMGGCITYFRRYALQSLLLLEAEDDDGNIASNKVNQPKPVSQPTNVNKSFVTNNIKKVGDICQECGGSFVKFQSGTIGCGNKCFIKENQHLRDEYRAKKEQLPVIQVDDNWPEVDDKTAAELFPG